MNSESLHKLEYVNRAFSLQSANYDEYDRENPTLTWMRATGYEACAQISYDPNDKILELNSGTGIGCGILC